MKVRIVGGNLGGRMIDAPGRRSTHVMSEKIRGALFNILGDLRDFVVLDAFAGSGALGLESLSRGAEKVIFVDQDRQAAQTVVNNTTLLGVAANSQVVNTTAGNWMTTNSDKHEQFDLIFADPPFAKPQFGTVQKLVDFLQPGGIMVLSVSGRMCVPTVEGVVVVDKREYGEANLVFFQKSEL